MSHGSGMTDRKIDDKIIAGIICDRAHNSHSRLTVVVLHQEAHHVLTRTQLGNGLRKSWGLDATAVEVLLSNIALLSVSVCLCACVPYACHSLQSLHSIIR
jgi:hypothetical protein